MNYVLVHLLDNKVFFDIDARYKHEDYNYLPLSTAS